MTNENTDGAGLIHQPIPDMAGTESRPSYICAKCGGTKPTCCSCPSVDLDAESAQVREMMRSDDTEGLAAYVNRDNKPRAQQAITRIKAMDTGVTHGTLSVPLALRREPTEKDFADPRFGVIWELIKRVDVDFRNGLFSGATGNDVCAVLDALDQIGSAPVPLSEALGSAGRSAAQESVPPAAQGEQ